MKASKDAYQEILADFALFMRLEKRLSPHTVAGYLTDCRKLASFLKERGLAAPEDATLDDLTAFLATAEVQQTGKRSQARLLSAIRSLYAFLEADGRLKGRENPSEKLESPRIPTYLPTVLTVDEVNAILDSVDLSTHEGHRNRAMLEMLYSCGLRVSELVSLHLSDIFREEGFVRVTGKGSKQRLVPIGAPALKWLDHWLQQRSLWPVQRGCDDIIFLNRRGGKITREMVFHIVRQQAEAAGIHKTISPHTFRHSFASHMVENGADLRVVQEMLGHESILTTEIYTHIDTARWHQTILRFHPGKE